MCRCAIATCVLLLSLTAVGAAGGQTQFAQGWREYSPSDRYEALRNYRRHQKLPREEQRAVERQYQRWQRMPDGERDRIRENYNRFRDLPQGERDQFERKYRAWKRDKSQ
jgi:hypothetical protein